MNQLDIQQFRPPVVSVVMVVVVLTSGLLLWQLLLRPRVVPGHLTAGGIVLVEHTGPANLDRAQTVLDSPEFVARLRAALPEDRALLTQWLAGNSHLQLEQGGGGRIVLDYTGPGYSIRMFDWQDFVFKYVGTQQAPSRDLANRLQVQQQRFAEHLAGRAAVVLDRVKGLAPRKNTAGGAIMSSR